MESSARGIPIVRFASIDSTSAHARREADAGRLGRSPVAFVAERQSAGVGRFGRRWESPSGGVWMTLAWPIRTDDIAGVLEGLGVRVGVACRRVVAKVLSEVECEQSVKLKWPNDVLVGGRKVLGALTEMVSRGGESWVLVGVGINANLDAAELPGAIAETATTMREAAERDVDLDRVVELTLAELGTALSRRGLDAEILREARENLFGAGEMARVSMPDGTEVRGVLVGLDEGGSAIFEVDGRRFVPPLGASIMLG